MTLPGVDPLVQLVRDGGAVLPPLVLAAGLLWYALALRALALRGSLVAEGRRRTQQARAAEADPARALVAAELALRPLEDALARGRTLARSIVVTAPLLGLLGTVSGMIETFDSLGSQSLFRASGGIAGGIAEALLTTQVGLCIAVPGVLVAKALDARELRVRAALAALLPAPPPAAGSPR